MAGRGGWFVTPTVGPSTVDIIHNVCTPPHYTANSHQARYCGREHQVADWKGKGGHKASCGQFAFLRACAEGRERLDRRDVVVKCVVGLSFPLICVAIG